MPVCRFHASRQFFSWACQEESRPIYIAAARGLPLKGKLAEDLRFGIGIMSEIQIAKFMGWTITQLREQPILHVQFINKYMNELSRVRKQQMKG